jgi:sugar lactone lactonase YvrE
MVGPATGNALPVDYKLGEYVIQAVLGQGGFGMTYLAHDGRLNTQVAIKEYFPQAYATRDSTLTIRPHTELVQQQHYEWGLNEFLKEAQALARFKHAHIVRVLRFLETNGTAYMVMEYEEGESLLTYLKHHGGQLAEPMLLNIFIPILTGLQAVHDAGLLHLDIKPDNIYLRKNGQPMLIDFGSSRQLREDAAANQRVAISRGYAAPEQYPGHGDRGPWSDVYGLGASLYRCVTARDPLDALERLRTFEKNKMDPLAPATSFERPHYAPHIRAAIDAALTLKTEDRPRSARALQNGLMGKPLTDEQAKPWAPYGRGAGFIGVTKAAIQKRRRVAGRSKSEWVIAVTVFVATLAVVIPKLLLDSGYLTEAEFYAQLDDAQAAVRSIPRRMKRVVDEDILGNAPAAPTVPVVRAPPTRPAPVKAIPPFEPAKQLARTLAAPAPAVSLAFVQDGQLVAGAFSDGSVQLWNVETGASVRTFTTKSKSHGVVAAAPGGQQLAYAAANHSVALWSASEDKLVELTPGHAEPINAIAFSADGKLLASGGEDKKVILWDLESGKALRTLNTRAVVLALTFAPNGRILAAADAAGAIQYWEVPGGGELAYTTAQDDALTTLAYSPDGKWLATAGQQNFLKLWRVGVERDDRLLKNAPEVVNHIAFSPDSKWLLLAGLTESIEIRDADSGEVANRLAGHAQAVRALAMSADGQWLATADSDNKVRLWH